MKLAACLFLGVAGAAWAQQPFYTDDANVTDQGHFHLEVSNQHSWLQREADPNLRQNTAVFQLNYGLGHRVEVGLDGPLIHLTKRSDPGVSGLGDLNATVKWNIRDEQQRRLAFTLSCAVEIPTGDVDKQLGSGVADFGCNTIAQKRWHDTWTVRVNNGLIFSGNTLTGVVGLTSQGLVYTGGISLTRQMTEKFQLGWEFTGAIAQKSELGKAALQTQVASKYAVTKRISFDLGLLAGHFTGSPRLGLQLGFTVDF